MKKQIKSFDHACEVLGITVDLSKFDSLGLPASDVKPLVDYYQITKIVEAINKLNQWTADWGNSRQWKYSPYFYIRPDAAKPAGFGFSYAIYGLWDAVTGVGSRLTVGSEEEARYLGETFIELFESAWLIIPGK